MQKPALWGSEPKKGGFSKQRDKGKDLNWDQDIRKEELRMRKKSLMVIAGIVCFMFMLSFSPSDKAQAAPKVFKFKMANYFPPPAQQSKICEEFAAELEKRTGGRIKIQYFAGGSLLKAPAIHKGITTGIADIGYSHVEYTPGRMPVTEACDLPLGYPSAWVGAHVVNDFYEEFKPKEWDKVHIMWFNTSNPDVMITTKPVRKIEDMKGLTIRAPGRVGDTVAALGASPAPTPVMETYDAMSKGVIQGVNIPYETLKTFRFAEVAKYVTVSWQVGNLYTFYTAINEKSYKKLPPDLKEIFDTLCGEFKERNALMWNSIDFVGKEFGQQKGLEFIELTPEQVEKWKSATEPVIENYIASMVKAGHAEAEVKGWIQFLRDRIDYWTKKQIQLYIKSPTGPPEFRP
jgi:TRAP-type C4-dicarboxylate transport system substrate-binding protein